MAYCTQQNLIDEFGAEEIIALTDRDRQGAIGAAVLDKCIARGDRLINQYLGDLPLPVPADTVTDIACDIVRYFLYTDAVPDQVAARYKDAVSRLSLMQKAQLNVVTPAGVSTTRPSSDVAFASDGLVFARGGHDFV